MSDNIAAEDEAAFDALPLRDQLTLRGALAFAEGLASLAGLRSDAADVHFARALAFFGAARLARAVGV